MIAKNIDRKPVIRFQWSVNDGNAGERKPRFTTIDMDELAESCLTIEHVRHSINEIITEAFTEEITPDWLRSEEDRIIGFWWKKRNGHEQK